MAAYAALASLAKITNLNQNQFHYSFSDVDHVEEDIRSIHEYVSFLLSFLEDFPEKAKRWEGKMRDLAHETEDVIEHLMWQHHRVMKVSSNLQEQLRNVKRELGVMAGETMEERPARVGAAAAVSPSSPTGNDAVVGLHRDILEIKELLCGYPLNLHSMKLLGDEMDEFDIELKVFHHLKGRRYLVVIDDIWGTHVWDDVRAMFPNDNNGSRIMLTTRQMDVAVYPYSVGPVHEMRFMSASESWDLLRRKVFIDGHCPPDLEDIGKEIARRCAGLPLSVVLVAGVLSPAAKTKASWEEIANNVNPVVGRELEEILSLSYTCLPHHLRPCFLFIGAFPKDVHIHTSRLIRLWVAEGFLKHQNGCSKSIEEEAEEYLEELVKINLVIVTSRKSDEKIKSCILHDMVRDVCIRKAEEEKFIHVMDGCAPREGLMNERRISFSSSDVGKILGPTFRTILCFQIQKFSSWLHELGSYKLLRELDASGVEMEALPAGVFELYHLRYLALMGSFSIPSALSNLVNLQTLVIHLPFGNLQGRYADVVPCSLPLEIWSLPQLRHLFFHAPYMLPHPPVGLSLPRENLQTLLLVADLVWDEKILQLIPNVKRLGLTYTSNAEHHLHHLKDLHQLQKLQLIGYPGFSWRVQNPSFPSTLKKLTLVGVGIPWEDMGIIGSLPNLQVLKLLDNACDGETWEMAGADFPLLKLLVIVESNLFEWTVGSDSFPTLKRLVLSSCPFLMEIPEDIGDIPTLELIEVDYCAKSLMESAKNIKEQQVDYGNDLLQVRIGHEVIQSFHKRIELLSEVEDQLKHAPEETGLTAGKMMQQRPASVLSPSSPAPTINNPVVGLDDDLMKIKERLCGVSPNLQVVPIVGKGGIGKTTLARTVYEDPSVLQHFDVRVWLTVSLDYSPHELRKNLLALLDSMKLFEEQLPGDNIDDFELALRVRIKLEGRRYLIVMDDVRDTYTWGYVRNIFPDDYNGSRVMVTSRLSYITASSDPYSPLHEMRP